MTSELINYVHKLYDAVDLSDTLIVGCQHFLKTNYETVISLKDKGVNLADVHLLSKVYSYNETIDQLLQAQGVKTYQSSFNSGISYDALLSESIYLSFDFEAIPKRFKKVILYDDGGSLIDFARHYNVKNICAVEQTSSGYNNLKNVGLDFPIVNVARSDAKLMYETPHIVSDFLDKLTPRLELFDVDVDRALILGTGIVAKELKNQLGFECLSYGIEDDESELVRMLQHVNLVIGATGQISLPNHLHKYIKKGTVLASISSSDREFDSAYLRDKLDRLCGVHEDLDINGIYLLNSGFPLNFQGGLYEVPSKYIQLTRALMLAGLFQAVDETRTGLVDLDVDIQKKIIDKYLSLIHN